MYHQQWAGQFDVNGQSSQKMSPMAPQPPVAPEPYMGTFSVSNGPETQPMSPPYYVNIGPPVDHPDQIMMRDGHHPSMGIHHREIPPTPLLTSHLTQYHRRPSPEDSILHSMPLDVPHSMVRSPRLRSGLHAPGWVKKHQSKRPGVTRTITTEDPISEHKNCYGQEIPPTLKSTCPDEERCIFESRWRHRNQKGEDMWESIQGDFKDRFQKCPGKEMLQMKFKRGRSEYLDWIPKDEDILREAWNVVEKSRYQMILETFYELGGSRNMRLSASDIEVKVINDLKLEEGIYIESYGDADIRRQRKLVSAGKHAGYGNDNNDVPSNDEWVSVGSHNTCEGEHTKSSVHSQNEGSSLYHRLWNDSVNSSGDIPRQQLDMLHRNKDVQKPAFQFDNSTIETTDSASGTVPDKLFHLESNIPVLQDVRPQNLDQHEERSISSCPVERVGDCIQFTDSAYISNAIQMRQINIKHCSPPIESPQKLDQVQGQSYKDEDAQTAYSDRSADVTSIMPSCSTTESSDFDLVSISHDSEIIDRSIRDSQAFQFFHRVFRRLMVLSQLEILSRGESNCKNSKGQQASGSSSLSDTSERRKALTLKHPRHDQGCGDEDSDKRDEPPLKRGKLRQSQCGARSQFLACPYWKLDPEKYWECFLKKNDTIGHLKQHLARRHTPKYYCQTCYAIFEEYGLYDSHVLERCCTRGPSAKLEGISQQQKNSLSRRSKGSVESQWYAVWSLLFPEVERPMTIYIYSTHSEDFCRIQEFAQRQGLVILLDELRSSGLVVRPGTSDQDLRSTLQRAINSMFRNYSDRRLQNAAGAQLPPSSISCQATDVRSPAQGTENESSTGSGIAVRNLSSATAAELEIPVDLTMALDNAGLYQAIAGTRPQPPAMAPRSRHEVNQDQIQTHQGQIYPATNLFSTLPFDESSGENDEGLDFGSYKDLEALDWDDLLLGVIDTSC